MRLLAALLLLVWSSLPALAQDSAQQQADRGFITDMITGALSGNGREVLIYGFAGALSSQATIDKLTVADDQGVWLTLEGLTLTWDRGALLTGRIEVQDLSAKRITVARMPHSPPSAPSPEAAPFKLPELPVAINIGKLEVGTIALGASIIGEPVELALQGDLSLEGGKGVARLTATRQNGPAGSFNVISSYSNVTGVLGLKLALDEASGGLATTLIGLPGAPALRLAIEGTAPLSAYAAKMSLATDGVERLTGNFALTSDGTGGAAQRLHLDVAGDVTTLFLPEYRAFFGTSVSLVADAAQTADGGIDLQGLQLSTAALRLSGNARIAADGWPAAFTLTGQMGDASGAPVLLPMAGPRTTVQGADLQVAFDAAKGPHWSATLDLRDLARPGLNIPSVTMSGGGVIRRPDGATPAQLTAALDYGATGLKFDSAGVTQALGDSLSGRFRLHRDGAGPVVIDALTLKGAGLALDGQASISLPDGGPQVSTSLRASATDLAQFSTLVGRSLGGGADLTLSATATPLDGGIDARISGTSTDLSVGLPPLDGVMRGTGQLAVRLVRDTSGTRIEGLSLQTPALKLTGQASITSAASHAQASLAITDAGLAYPGLTGPATLNVDAGRAANGGLTLSADASVGAATAKFDGTSPDGTSPLDLRLTTTAPDLARFALLAGRPLAGSLAATITGAAMPDASTADLHIDATMRDIGTGIAALDGLLRGQGTLTLDARRKDGTDSVSNVTLATPAIHLTGNANMAEDGPAAGLDLTADLPDLARVLPQLAGAGRISAKASRDATGATTLTADATAMGATLRADLTQPAGGDVAGKAALNAVDLGRFAAVTGRALKGALNAQVTGSIATDMRKFDLTVTGTSQDLALGQPQADAVLRGAGQINAHVLRDRPGGLRVEDIALSTPALTVSGGISGEGTGGTAHYSARLADLGLIAPDFRGPATANGTAKLEANGDWSLSTDATGPGGTNATLNGRIHPDMALDLTLAGQAPLGLLNGVLSPRRLAGVARFDLALKGPPALSSMTGTIRASGAQLSAPTLGQSIEGIDATVTLSGGSARLVASGASRSGGQLGVRGPVGLAAPYSADLNVTLSGLVLKDPTLYQTTVSGALTVKGPLTGGARIAGNIDVGQTEVQVPSSPIGALGDLPDVTHLGASAPVRRTLARAGASAAPATSAALARSRPYPLDITIRAPQRIFVRGRGLDAELGGTLRITGTSANVVPAGDFSLIRGRIDILQQRFDLDEGAITLAGNFVPTLRLVASTTARSGTAVKITVSGPATEPTVTFSSSPELPQDEVLSQLLFGRDLKSISPLQAVQLASAVATLAGRGGSGIIDNLRKGIGVDDIDLTSDASGNAAVRVGKYLTDKVYTDVTIGSDGTSTINLNLDVTPTITATGSAASDGTTGLGIFYQKDY
ncbi:MAG: hypothetical protein GC146_02330 [Limimaricola sp.]|uniref:translocation/assembly module TamB domain-containing protein n=1 Tax=Limimaricola sp. TaxID=2211665 RepID=UPI001D47B84F|nr:translocation/assembly module TamB domain-containing protein [Limimaricola sp.]MBI1416036.1 hypothetical protein [Limimaricola sp.]